MVAAAGPPTLARTFSIRFFRTIRSINRFKSEPKRNAFYSQIDLYQLCVIYSSGRCFVVVINRQAYQLY